MLILPASLIGTSVAVPQINADFEPSLVALQWVVNSYNLMFACFILVCGSLADVLGRKRIFVAGTVLFGACSLVGAFSQGILTLDVARGLSGIGAAAMMTGGSALIANTFSGPKLAKAFAIFGSSAGAGLALGPSLSGFLVGIFNWRAVFLAYLVVAVVILLLAFAVKDRGAAASGARVDWAGTFTFTPALFTFVFGVMQGPQLGWGSPVVIGFIVATIILGVLFVVVEPRAKYPMFDVDLFRQPKFFTLCMIPVALAFGFVALLVYLPIYFTASYGMSPGTVGIVIVLMTIPVIFVPLISGWLLSCGASARWLLITSLLLVALGAALLTVIGPETPIWAIAPALLLIGAGMGLSAGILDGAAVGSVEPHRAGMAAGMFNTNRLAGETIAIAFVGTLLVAINIAGAIATLVMMRNRTQELIGDATARNLEVPA
ncbi:MFS transporter [Arthrobacter sp. TMN-49]